MTISEKMDWFIFIVLPQCGFHSRKRCILFTYYIYVCIFQFKIDPNTWIELKCINRFGLSWQEDVLVVTFFVTQEHGLLLQDSQPKPASLLSLLAVDTPYYYYICKVQTHKIQTLSFPFLHAFLSFCLHLYFSPFHLIVSHSDCSATAKLLFRRGGLVLPDVSTSQLPSAHLGEESPLITLPLFIHICFNNLQRVCVFC